MRAATTIPMPRIAPRSSASSPEWKSCAGRNDVGGVAELGTVETNEYMRVERYSQVMPLVSNGRGRARGELQPLDIVRACFPAGTVSGAPKVRSMEIIESLEPLRRGIYAG